MMFEGLKRILRPPEAKASRTSQVLAFESGGRARWTPRDYAALAREGYLANAIVHRAVRLIAENAASCGFLLYEGAQEREAHPLLHLLTRPNARQDGASFFEALYAHMLLAGNAYVEAVGLGDEVRELYTLRPDRMKVVPGHDGWAEAYDYSVAGRSVRFDQLASSVPPILHLTFFHPLDDHYGLAPIEAAAVAVELTFECGALWVVLVHEFWTGDMTAINALIGATGLLVSYWGFRFGVLGVYMSGRTREKVCAATGQNDPGILGKLVKTVAKK